MESRVVSIETQIALMQKDISELRNSTSDLPPWLKKSALSMLGVMFLQLSSTIWWAAELTTKQNIMLSEVQQNTAFRMEFPKLHEEVMVGLKEIQVNLANQKEMLHEVKNKLRFVPSPQQ
jgi:hypothetical protein